ncbi:unnamed protein product [Lymnaea stagnalis]|uniref:Fibronectin type-III domain-containing protein n=1 Tax=Lymnaea stagnalis TaxID=6523 RepID=A0AAV2HMR3_LYMST
MKLKLLHELLIYATIFTMIDAQSAIRCPAACQCSTEYYVYCQSIQLTDSQLAGIISAIAPTAILLDLSSNQITRIPRGSFIRLQKLKYLNLAANGIVELEENTFSDLPELEELNLRGNDIGKLHQNSLNGLFSLKDLHLGDNMIASTPLQIFSNLTLLEKLHLQKNIITDLTPRAFFGLDKLQKLNLSQNLLKTIPGLTFLGLSSLRRLSLTDNLISEFAADAFKGLSSLEELLMQKNDISDLIFMFGNDFYNSLMSVSLAGNLITHVPSHVFPHNSNLKQIDLSDNLIRRVGGQSFNNLYLETLQLQKNNLTEVTKEMFDAAKRISELTLSYNRIQDIATGAFDSFRETLLVLDLHLNQLTGVHPGMFRGMRRLRVLNMAANTISSLDRGSFQDLENLEELNISGNKFTVLESGTISGPQGLRKLLLVCNPLQRLVGFSFDHVTDRIYIETNSSIVLVSASTALVTWPYREGTQLYWTLSVTCGSSLHCDVPTYESTLRPFVTQVTLTGLTPGAEYFVCVSPVFLSGDVNVSQCVHVLTDVDSPSSIKHTTVPSENSLNSSQPCSLPRDQQLLLLLFMCFLHTLISS